MAKQPKTYVAPHPVYVDRQYHRANRPFTTEAEKGDKWEEVSTAEQRVAEAQDPIPGGVPLEAVGLAGLKAIAVDQHINPKGMSEKDLITAIKAANEPKL